MEARLSRRHALAQPLHEGHGCVDLVARSPLGCDVMPGAAPAQRDAGFAGAGVQGAEQGPQHPVRSAPWGGPIAVDQLRHQHPLALWDGDRLRGRAPLGREPLPVQGLEDEGVALDRPERPRRGEDPRHPARTVAPVHPQHAEVELGDPAHGDAVAGVKVIGKTLEARRGRSVSSWPSAPWPPVPVAFVISPISPPPSGPPPSHRTHGRAPATVAARAGTRKGAPRGALAGDATAAPRWPAAASGSS